MNSGKNTKTYLLLKKCLEITIFNKKNLYSKPKNTCEKMQ